MRILVDMTSEEEEAWSRLEAAKPITEYDDRIIEMYNDRMTIRDMSSAIGVTYNRVGRRLSELIRKGDLVKRPPVQRTGAMTDEQRRNKRREYQRRRRAENREGVREYRRRYYQKNRQKIKENARLHREKNRDRRPPI